MKIHSVKYMAVKLKELTLENRKLKAQVKRLLRKKYGQPTL